ncbi:serpin A3-3-like [Hyperolius riggenbachi]|uniref:serpin A3-3-like n=1 Tax=Hyperolius riggenbachi TaxID=752182 RepID=UPI0035A279A7
MIAGGGALRGEPSSFRTMRILLILCLSEALLCLGIFGYSCKDNHHHAKDHHEDDHVTASYLSKNISSLQKITPGNIKFAYRLYTHLATKYPSDNIFFSPISISMAFSMLSAGAKGQTQTEILEGLGFNTSSVSQEDIHRGFHQFISILEASNRDVQLHTANALFVQKDQKLLEEFLEDLNVFYHSKATSTDFHNAKKAKSKINKYVAENTCGKISNLLDTIDPNTLLILVNTIYFKGDWETPFKTLQGKSDFHVDDNTVIKVKMMSSKGTHRVADDKEIGCTVVEIPYHGNVSAILVLPDKGKLHEVEKALQSLPLPHLMEKRLIHLLVPKFSISPSLDLKEELSEMGMVKVFSGDADLSGINGVHNLLVSKAIHKSVVSVNENGTEAAGATAIGVVATSVATVPIITMDRPFLMTILDKSTRTILFAGRIMRPEN